MSYTYLQEQGEESSAECFADIPASVLWKLNLTAGKVCSNGSETAFSRASRSGMTSEHLTAARGENWWTLFAADFPAKESASLATAPDSTTKNQDCGSSKGESLARLDRASCSLRTHQHLLFEAGLALLERLPNWGTIVAGELYPLPTPSGLLELRAWIISESASGFTERFPTATVQDAHGRDRHNQKGGGVILSLLGVARIPTPDAHCWKDGPRGNGTGGAEQMSSSFVKRLATPKSVASGPDYARRNREGSGGDDLATQIGGQLNPDWVEWLMGWPIGWTDLKPLETARFQQWLNSHGKR